MAKTTVTISEKKFVDLFDKKLYRSIEVFIALRSKFDNGVIYKFTYLGLQALTGIPSKTIHRHVHRLMEEGMLSIHHGNLCCTGTDKQAKSIDTNSRNIKILVDKDRQRELIEHAILKRVADNKAYRIAERNTTGQKKGARRLVIPVPERCIDSADYVGLGIRGYATHLRLESRQAQRRKKALIEKGLIQAKHKFKVLKKLVTPLKYHTYLKNNPEKRGITYLCIQTMEIRQRLIDELLINSLAIPSPHTPLNVS